MKIDLENIKSYSLPLTSEIIERYFNDDKETKLTSEHDDQIFMFQTIASQFLWDLENKMVGFQAKPKFYKTITKFETSGKTLSEIKKYLYKLEIPFSDWVFFSEQPDLGFMLTWKMIIKYAKGIFWDDYQQIWDKTFNWKLEYNHGVFTFGKDLIYKSNENEEKRLLWIDEMKKKEEIVIKTTPNMGFCNSWA